MWGVISLESEPNEIHVVPFVNGDVMQPHTLTQSCACRPTVTQYVQTLVEHNMIH